MSRRIRIVQVAILGWLGAVGCTPPAAPSDPAHPTVILISFDTCRADVFGVLSGDVPSLTPRLDEFAADSVVFENAFVQAPHTLPSHMSMITSLYPDAHGVKPDEGPLPEGVATLPQILQQAGWRTAGVVTSEWLKPDFGFGRGFDEYELLPHRPTYAERVNAAALRHLKRGGQPIFLFLHYYDLHSDFDQGGANKLPYYSPPQYREGLGVSADGGEFCDEAGNCNTRYLMAMDRERRVLPQDHVDTIHRLYRAAVPHLDAEMGRFFDELRKSGVYDDALIIVTSDHGEEFREHGRFIHSQPYDETIRVPLFVKLPGNRAAGTRVAEVVESIDLLPTLLETLGLAIPESALGGSLVGLIDGTGGRRGHAVLSQDTITLTRYGLRTDGEKLIMNLRGPRRELYDLAEDPSEEVDLAAERGDEADELESRLKRRVRHNRALHATYAEGQRTEEDLLSEEERKRLESLGYVN